MTKVKYYINIETPHTLNNEQKMEMLADIRNSIRNVRFNLPDIKVVVGRELTNEDIVEGLRNEGRSMYDCIHYDEAQGRNLCVNPLTINKFCVGVCKDWKDNNIKK